LKKSHWRALDVSKEVTGTPNSMKSQMCSWQKRTEKLQSPTLASGELHGAGERKSGVTSNFYHGIRPTVPQLELPTVLTVLGSWLVSEQLPCSKL
jgi:hypothetical protein